MFEPFIMYAVLAGLGIAMVAGPLGCFVVWRRMAYFGDTLSHAGLMGIAFGLLTGIDPTIGIIATCVAIGGLLFALQFQRRIPTDTLLGVLSHGALAVGLIAVSTLQNVRVDLTAYLFGDILAITDADLAWIYVGGIAVLCALAVMWRRLVALTVNEDIARAEGYAGTGVRLAFTVLIAITVAIAMKIVGILLVTALLIIPPAAARRMARGPEAMTLMTVAVGALATVGGIWASFVWDIPSGAAIVVTASCIFALSIGLGKAVRG
ncbi:MAG: metal ABC transporter permease [Rhodospirillaceae bacterium]